MAMEAFTYLVKLLKNLCFPISESKLVSPTTRCNCLGIIVNTDKCTLSVPELKLQEIMGKCERITRCTEIKVKVLQSLLGSLMFIHKCVRPSRFFVNRLLEALRNVSTNTVKVSQDMKRDIMWFINFLPKFYGVTTYKHDNIPYTHTLEIDACLRGLGGVWNNNVFACQLTDQLVRDSNLNITHYEMLNIIVVLNVWGVHWKNKKVQIKTDNMAVVDICRSGYARDKVLAAYVRNIWALTARYDIELVVVHIQGKAHNTADLLSRWEGSIDDYQKLGKLVNNPIWHDIKIEYLDVNFDI